MRRAQRRDAARQQTFFFRRSIYPDDVIPHGHSHFTPSPSDSSVHTPEGSSSPFSRSPQALHFVLPVNPHEQEYGEYDGSSGTSTPESISENLSILSSKKLRGGSYPNSIRDRPLSAAQSRCLSPALPTFGAVEDEYEELSIAEIISGKGEFFPGLLGVVNAYLDTLNVEFAAKKRIRAYLNLIKWRADGTLQTTATWMRNFIRSHPAYKQDSVVSDEINFDLMNALDEIERGTRTEPDLLPNYYVGSKSDDGCL